MCLEASGSASTSRGRPQPPQDSAEPTRSLASFDRWLVAADLVTVDHCLDVAAVPTPATRHLIDCLSEDLSLLDLELTTDGEVVEGACGRCRHDVESGQVAARSASVSGLGHAGNGTPSEPRSGHSSVAWPTELVSATGRLLKGERARCFEPVDLVPTNQR